MLYHCRFAGAPPSNFDRTISGSFPLRNGLRTSPLASICHHFNEHLILQRERVAPYDRPSERAPQAAARSDARVAPRPPQVFPYHPGHFVRYRLSRCALIADLYLLQNYDFVGPIPHHNPFTGYFAAYAHAVPFVPQAPPPTFLPFVRHDSCHSSLLMLTF